MHRWTLDTSGFLFAWWKCKCCNANAHRPTLRLDLTVTSGATRGWMARGSVLPATHKFSHTWNEPSCMHFVSIHQMASPEQGGKHLDLLTTHLSMPKIHKSLIYSPFKTVPLICTYFVFGTVTIYVNILLRNTNLCSQISSWWVLASLGTLYTCTCDF